MDTMESLHERVQVLEYQIEALIHRTHRIERRSRWLYALACGLLALGLFTLPLPSITAQEESAEYRGIRNRLAALEYKLRYVSGGPNEVVISGANLRIVNGLGITDCGGFRNNPPIPNCPNGLGNLIVGYNELRFSDDVRTGSHNVVVGTRNNFSSFGGLVVGDFNEISGEFSSVSAGTGNTASGDFASVSGGIANRASGVASWVSGFVNTASGGASSVSGGRNRTAPGENNWAAGPLFAAN